MADEQVIAIYYSFLEKGKFDRKPKKKEEPAMFGPYICTTGTQLRFW